MVTCGGVVCGGDVWWWCITLRKMDGGVGGRLW